MAERTNLAPRYVGVLLARLRHRGAVVREGRATLRISEEVTLRHPMLGQRPLLEVLRLLDGEIAVPRGEGAGGALKRRCRGGDAGMLGPSLPTEGR